jgi:hypothetical protein
MFRRITLPVLLVGLVFGLAPAHSEPADGLRSFDAGVTAIVTDRQGVRTELTGFGRLFGPDFLLAHHGDALVQIPFRKVRTFKMGTIVDRLAPIEMTLTGGKRLQLVVDQPEYQQFFAGNATFGYYKIRLGDIATCEIHELDREPGLGRRCEHGHLFYNDAWRFCPYDGKALRPIVSIESKKSSEGR